MALCLLLCTGAAHAVPGSLYLQDLSSAEVRNAVQAGVRIAIIPVGGTEQNGPHMALGKHNFRVHALAGQIASELGNALVAPVMAYVPEGDLSPANGHMRFAGTLSVPEDAFKAVLSGAARSLAAHGFTDIVFIGDSGNYQGALKVVAQQLNRQWKAGPARAHHVADYYDAAQQPFIQQLRRHGLTDAEIGTHAGAADTALMLAVDASRVLPGKMVADAAGVTGDPRRATVELGRIGVTLVVQRSVAAIRMATAPRR
jgi:creatinine amidohydrolase/Fe(II)-dependent formamide hydrolase-like protein